MLPVIQSSIGNAYTSGNALEGTESTEAMILLQLHIARHPSARADAPTLRCPSNRVHSSRHPRLGGGNRNELRRLRIALGFLRV